MKTLPKPKTGPQMDVWDRIAFHTEARAALRQSQGVPLYHNSKDPKWGPVSGSPAWKPFEKADEGLIYEWGYRQKRGGGVEVWQKYTRVEDGKVMLERTI